MTNQETNVLTKLTNASYPRTLDALVAETGYPKASIRRCIHALNRYATTYPQPEFVSGLTGILLNRTTGEYRLQFAPRT